MHFPFSIRRLRLFELGLGLQIAFGLFVALAGPAPAAAQIQACNSTRYPVVFVFSRTWNVTNAQGTQILGKATEVSGWYSLAPTACQILMNTTIFGYTFYFFGYEMGNPKSGVYQGNYPRCVSTNMQAHFLYSNAQATPPCPAGEKQVNMTLFSYPAFTNGLPTKGATMYFLPGPNG